MENININLSNEHLNKRYLELVKAHCQHAASIASGPAIPADAASSFAATQATWRFFANEKVTPQALVEPLRDFAQQQIDEGTLYVLSIIDWSKLDYRHHTAKKDIVQLTHDTDVGYELTTQLLVNADNGQPIAPIQMHLKTANGYLTTSENPVPDEHKLEQLTPLMDESREMNFSATLVHIIDREADAVRLYRQWCEKGHTFLVRGDDRRVTWEDESLLISEIEAKIDAQDAFQKSREVTIKGKKGNCLFSRHRSVKAVEECSRLRRSKA